MGRANKALRNAESSYRKGEKQFNHQLNNRLDPLKVKQKPAAPEFI